MEIREVIENFSKQFGYEPVVENASNLNKKQRVVVGGMGGSHLAADLLKACNPEFDLRVHYDYGLPSVSNPENVLFVASSYSGNTEEIIDFFEKAVDGGYSVAVIGTGGKLIDMACDRNVPYVVFPTDALQPRLAVGYSIRALLKIIGDEGGLAESSALADRLDARKHEEAGKALSEKIGGSKIVAIYSSKKNMGVALNWRVNINETAKMPAYFHVFPELNHNEMASDFGSGFSFVILKRKDDDPRILKRMDALAEIYKKNGLSVEIVELESGLSGIFSSAVLAVWTSYFLAVKKNVDPLSVPKIEDFKKLIVRP